MPEGICSLPDCGGPVKARGWCNKHWRRWRKHGDPNIVTFIRLTGTPEERFWPRVNRNGPIPTHRPELGPCWIWTGSVDPNGYGRFALKSNQTVLAHRFAIDLLEVPIPIGLEPDHLCRVPACLKVVADERGPAHLEAVTHRENSLRGNSPSAISVRTNRCPRGHLFDEANTYWTSAGKRQCRTCNRERQRRRRAA